MSKLIEIISTFSFKQGRSYHEIQQISFNLNKVFPDDYIELLLFGDEIEGEINDNYFSFWPLLEIEKLNSEYNIQNYLGSEILCIASDGGGEAYIYDYSISHSSPCIGLVPFGDLDNKSIKQLGSSLIEVFNVAKSFRQ